MPRYTDPATGRTIRSETPLSDADLEEAFGAGPPGEPADSGGFLNRLVNATQEPIQRGLNYLGDRAADLGGALGRLSQPMPKEPSTFREKLSQFGSAAGDIATISGPLLAPGLTGGGALVGAMVRGGGGTEDTARAADLATNIVGGLGQAGLGAWRGLRAAHDITEEGAQLQTIARGQYRPPVPAPPPVAEGQRLSAAVPGMRTAASRSRAALFDPIIEAAERGGHTLSPEAATRLQHGLLAARDEWGDVANATENRVVRDILARLRPIPERIIEGAEGIAGTRVIPGGPAPPLSLRELDDAVAVLNMQGKKAFATRRALVTAMEDLGRGTPIEGQLSAAGSAYHQTIKPGMYFAGRIARAGTPGQQARTAVSLWDNLGSETQQVIDPSGEIARLVARARPVPGAPEGATDYVLRRIAESRTPGEASHTALRLWDELTPAGQQALDPTGRIAELIRTGRQARAAGIISGMTIGIGGGAATINAFTSGDIKGGFKRLFLTLPSVMALRYPGMAGAVVRGAAPGLIRGGAAATSNPATRDLLRSRAETPPETPAEPERQGEAPPVQPAPHEAPAAPQAPGDAIDRVANLAGVPAPVLRGIISQESGGDVKALSSGGWAGTPAHGIMQITPGTFETIRPQVEQLLGRPAALGNPLDNLLGGALLWRKYLDQTGGDLGAAARLYHGGENPAYHGPRTQQYASDILSRLEAR